MFFSYSGRDFANDFLSRQSCQKAVIDIFEKRNKYSFKNCQVLPVFVKNNSKITIDIGANILFYRVVRVIPPNYYVHRQENGQPWYKYKYNRVLFRKQKLFAKKKVPNLIKIILKFVLHTTVIFKNRVISPFLNMTLPFFWRTTQSKLKNRHLASI